jgi:hypothetical protein
MQLSRRQVVRVLIAITLLTWSTTTLLRQWGL